MCEEEIIIVEDKKPYHRQADAAIRHRQPFMHKDETEKWLSGIENELRICVDSLDFEVTTICKDIVCVRKLIGSGIFLGDRGKQDRLSLLNKVEEINSKIVEYLSHKDDADAVN